MSWKTKRLIYIYMYRYTYRYACYLASGMTFICLMASETSAWWQLTQHGVNELHHFGATPGGYSGELVALDIYFCVPVSLLVPPPVLWAKPSIGVDEYYSIKASLFQVRYWLYLRKNLFYLFSAMYISNLFLKTQRRAIILMHILEV